MAKQWYIVHTFSGYEQKAKAALEERIKALGKQEHFGEILVPVEKVVELVKGKKKTSSRKFFPAAAAAGPRRSRWLPSAARVHAADRR